jgi:hypothetical protein
MAFLTHQIFLLSGSIPILQGGPLFRGKTTCEPTKITFKFTRRRPDATTNIIAVKQSRATNADKSLIRITPKEMSRSIAKWTITKCP